MKKNGFTLVELMGILIILSIITMLVVLNVGPATNRQRKKAFIETCNGIIEATELYAANNGYVFPLQEMNLTDKDSPIKLKNRDQITSGFAYMQETVIYIKDVSNGLFCANGTKGELIVTKGSCGEGE